jgi:hypothetical protein
MRCDNPSCTGKASESGNMDHLYCSVRCMSEASRKYWNDEIKKACEKGAQGLEDELERMTKLEVSE